MKRLLFLLIPLVMLAGCKEEVPVTVKWPDVPKELIEACPDLKQVNQDTTKLSEVVSVVVDNYAQYYECKVKVDNWIEWYKSQKEIFDKVGK